MGKIRIYPKVYRRDNDKDTWKPETKKENRILIQEKIDGSNFAFGLNDGKFKIYSRTNEITNLKEFGKTKLDEVRGLEDKIRKMFPDYRTIMFYGEILGQAKLSYNKEKSGKLKDSFFLFDMFYSKDQGHTKTLIEEGFGEWADYTKLESLAKLLIECQVVPIIKIMSYEEWQDKQNELFNKYVQNNDNVYPSLINETESPREGVVVKVESTPMRYKIVSAAFREKQGLKGKVTEKAPLEQKIAEMFMTDGRIEKTLQKLQLSGKFDGDRKNKRNYSIMLGSANDMIEDIFEEEIEEIKTMIAKELRRLASKRMIKYIEQEGTIKCEVCEEEINKDDLHPEKRTCPKCGKYALKRKVMLWDKDKEEYYLLDQVTGEKFSQIKQNKFEKESNNE